VSTKTKWFSGPPPSVGWWPASVARNHGYLRWWDGHEWSWSCLPGFTRSDIDYRSARKSISEDIEWTHRPKNWPKRSKT
jgi:hypothetical protein